MTKNDWEELRILAVAMSSPENQPPQFTQQEAVVRAMEILSRG